SRAAYDYHACRDCGTLQLQPMPTAAELAAAYETEYAHSSDAHMHFADGAAEPEAISDDNSRYYDALIATVKERRIEGKVLELGCGYGALVRKGLAAGLRWQGVDLSEHAVAYCRSKNLPVERAALSQVAGTFDAVVMCFMFEHLPDYDAFFREARRALTPRGSIITLHPTATFPRLAASLARFGSKRRPLPAVDAAFKPPWHTVLPSTKGMKSLAERNHLRLVSISPAPIGRFGHWTRRAAQTGLDGLNRIGWRLGGAAWPLLPAHIVVFELLPAQRS
ncbi:MAG TPA: class I SAM-dependent methyltransferase, partial [Thermoanaerobaculia bacterium]|nr:class I SAM-dependent methyltransferase [Thermoanaerobaculia bacterium]